MHSTAYLPGEYVIKSKALYSFCLPAVMDRDKYRIHVHLTKAFVEGSEYL